MDPAKAHHDETALPCAAPSADAEPAAAAIPPSLSEKALSPEEQMARYEHSLKEEDWGHQPC